MGEAYTSPIWLCTECRTPHPQPSPPAICSACKKAVSFTQQPLHWKENELPAEDHIEDTREPEQVVDAVNSPMVPGSPNPALESHTIKPLQYRLEEAQGYFVAKVTGKWDVDAICRLIDAIGRDSSSHSFERILADCLDIEIAGRVMKSERFVVGRHIGETLRHVRLATLFPEEQIDKVAESIAVAAGAEFLVTSSRQEALRWLMKGPSRDDQNE